jgi:branched-subunit amino acid transport protein
MKNYLPLILGMTMVTFLPRLLPLITLADRPIHPLIKRFLLYIPYTALSALIASGIMQAEGTIRLATLAGLGAAAICSWFKGGLIVSVVVSIATSFLVLNGFNI